MPKETHASKPSGVLVGVRAVVFLVLAAALFVYLNMAFVDKGTAQNRGNMEAFYGLEHDVVDVLYVGTSATSRLFVNPVAFHDYGIASYTFGTQSGPVFYIDNLIKEARLTQNPSLYIIELRELTKSRSTLLEISLDSLNLLSAQRPEMAWEASVYDKEDSNTSFSEYLFPIARYHERLLQGDMDPEEFLLQGFEINEVQGFRLSKPTVTQAAQSAGAFSKNVGTLSDDRAQQLDSLLDFCDTLDADVLFVFTPFSVSEERMSEINAVQKVVEERGYAILNCNDEAICADIGIDWKTDFYNENHTNYLGAEKYTDYLSRYLKAHYNLPDRRGDATYDAWVHGYDVYKSFVEAGIVYKAKGNVSDDD